MRFFRTFLLSAIIGGLVVIALNAAIDPLRYFSDDSIADFEGQTRFRYPGFIRNKHYDAVFFGTSMAQSFVMADIDALFDTRSLLLAIPGASLYEQYLALALALRTGKPDTVFWELYEGALVQGPAEVRKEGSFPFYLYDSNPFNDIFYLFNFSTVALSLEALQAYLAGERVDQDRWITMEYRSNRHVHGCPQLMQAQLRHGGLLNPREDRVIAAELIRENIDRNLLALVRNYPGVEFVIYAPPVSYPYQAMMQDRQPRKFAAMQRAKQHAYAQLLLEPNVRLYEFFSDREITANLDNYRDLMHFSGELSRELLLRLQRDENRVGGNWAVALQAHIDRLSSFPLAAVLEECLAQPVAEQGAAVPN